MLKSKIGLIFIGLLLAAAFLTAPLRADSLEPGKGNIKIGPLQVHPFVGITEAYSDNVYRNYGGLKSESDFITTLSPGLILKLPFQRHSLQVDYRADVNWFSSNTSTNYTNQQVGGKFKLDFPGGLMASVSDYYNDAKIPRKAKEIPGLSGPADPFRELPYRTNDLNAQVKYRFVDRWAVEARYNNYDYAYSNSSDRSGDWRRNLYGGSAYYRFTPKIDALVDYNYSTVEYPNNKLNDNKNNYAYLGVSFDPTSKVNGYAKVGWGEKKYDNQVAGRNNSFSIFSALLDLTYALSPSDTIRLRGDRTIQEDVDTNAPFTNTDVSLIYRHTLAWNEKVTLLGNVGYRTLKFEADTFDIDGASKTRDDRQWYAGVGVEYFIQRWLSLGLNYSYVNNDSNFKNYNYRENRVWFNALFAF